MGEEREEEKIVFGAVLLCGCRRKEQRNKKKRLQKFQQNKGTLTHPESREMSGSILGFLNK